MSFLWGGSSLACNHKLNIIPFVITIYFRVVYECKPASVHKELILPIKKKIGSFHFKTLRMCADAMCAANWSRLSRPVPCLAFVWAESTNYILLAGGQALNDTIPQTNITQQTLLTRVRVELRHRTRDARLAASNQASAGNKPTVLMKKGASSLLIIMQCARTDHYQNNWWIL